MESEEKEPPWPTLVMAGEMEESADLCIKVSSSSVPEYGKMEVYLNNYGEGQFTGISQDLDNLLVTEEVRPIPIKDLLSAMRHRTGEVIPECLTELMDFEDDSPVPTNRTGCDSGESFGAETEVGCHTNIVRQLQGEVSKNSAQQATPGPSTETTQCQGRMLRSHTLAKAPSGNLYSRPLKTEANTSHFTATLQALVGVECFVREVKGHIHDERETGYFRYFSELYTPDNVRDFITEEECPRCAIKDVVEQLLEFGNPTMVEATNLLGFLNGHQNIDKDSECDPNDMLILFCDMLALTCFSFETTTIIRCTHCEDVLPIDHPTTQQKIVLELPEQDKTLSMKGESVRERVIEHFGTKQFDDNSCQKAECDSTPDERYLNLLSTPLSLVIQVQKQKDMDVVKVDKKIKIPSVELNQWERYEIKGVICHCGPSKNTGRYVCLRRSGDGFIELQDDMEELYHDTVCGSEPYLLIYEKSRDIEDDSLQEKDSRDEDYYAREKEVSDSFHNKLIMSRRLLVVCVPRCGNLQLFSTLYKRAKGRKKNRKKILFTLTWEGSSFLKKLERDPEIRKEYLVFGAPLLNKPHDVNCWFAEASMAYILYCQLNKDSIFEYIFDPNPSCAVTTYMARYWDELLPRVLEWVPDLISEDDESMFCIGPCETECKFRHNYHLGLWNLALRNSIGDPTDESSIDKWRCVGREMTDHYLENLLYFPEVDCTNKTEAAKIVQDHLKKLNFSMQGPFNLYILLVVTAPDGGHEPHELQVLWDSGAAEFAIYVGITRHGDYRKEHLDRVRKTTAVSEYLTQNSVIYHVLTKEYSTYPELAKGEAQGIGVLKQYEDRRLRKCRGKKIKILNKVLPGVPLFEAKEDERRKYNEYVGSGEILFSFIKNDPDNVNKELLFKHFVGAKQRVVEQAHLDSRQISPTLIQHTIPKLLTSTDGLLSQENLTDSSNLLASTSQATKDFSQKQAINLKTISVKKDKTEQKNFTCPLCKKMFTRKTRLNSHMRIHSGEKPYQCKECGESYAWQTSLKRHMKIHEEAERFKCEMCEKRFTRPDSLKEHIKTHTGAKPFVCKVCGKGFTQSSTLRVHQNIHTGAKPFVCKVCGKGFTQSSTLRGHRNIHTGAKPYVCEVCGRGFTQSSNLREHRNIHTGAKPYVCEVCGTGFAHKKSLREHRNIHTGAKPYVCEVCGTGFANSSTLSGHRTTHKGSVASNVNIDELSIAASGDSVVDQSGAINQLTNIDGENASSINLADVSQLVDAQENVALAAAGLDVNFAQSGWAAAAGEGNLASNAASLLLANLGNH